MGASAEPNEAEFRRAALEFLAANARPREVEPGAVGAGLRSRRAVPGEQPRGGRGRTCRGAGLACAVLRRRFRLDRGPGRVRRSRLRAQPGPGLRETGERLRGTHRRELVPRRARHGRADDPGARHGAAPSPPTYARCGGPTWWAVSCSRSRTPAPTSRTSPPGPPATGTTWLVTGQKVWTSGAHYSDLGLLLARTSSDGESKHAGLTMFLVDMHAPGIDIRPLRQMTGGTSFNEVFLTDVRIPDWHRLGEVGDGWRVARTTLTNERAAIGGGSASSGFSTTRRLFEAARQSGAAEDPVIRQRLAELWIRSEITRFSRLRTAARLRAGQTPGPEQSVAKLFLVETQTLMVELATRDPRSAAGRRHRGVGDLRLGRVRPRRSQRPHRRRHRRDPEEHPRRARARTAPLMTLDPRTPVVVGVAQTLRRPPDLAAATEPVAMMVEALRLAGGRQRGRRRVARAGRLDPGAEGGVLALPATPGRWSPPELGIAPAETVYCADGGNTPQRLLNDAAESILRGERDVVLLVGAEATYTRQRGPQAQGVARLAEPDRTGAAEPVRRRARAGRQRARARRRPRRCRSTSTRSSRTRCARRAG